MTVVSAGDVSRYGYCAHNWWLARKGMEGSSGDGVAYHQEQGEAQQRAERADADARQWLRWSFRILAFAASLTFLLVELALLVDNENHVAFLSLALVIVAMSAGLLTMAGLHELRARKMRAAAGLVPGQLIESDLVDTTRLLRDPEWDLQGRPDYTIQAKTGAIPVEVKSGRTPDKPYESHVLQVAAYLRLMEVDTGKRPEYGLITYPKGTFRVEWDDHVEGYLKATIDRIHAAEAEGKADRDHEHVGRCIGCARRKDCDQKLA